MKNQPSSVNQMICKNAKCQGEQKEALLELNPLPLEGDLLKTLHLDLKKYRHPPLAIY
jgi:hypothetical protein